MLRVFYFFDYLFFQICNLLPWKLLFSLLPGSAAGHYTSYAKNPRTSEWHYFNDDVVTKQKPQEEDYSNAYILFYQKQGIFHISGWELTVEIYNVISFISSVTSN